MGPAGGAGPAEADFRARSEEEVDGQIDEADNEGTEEGAAEGGDGEAGHKLAGEEEEDGIDEEETEPKGEDDKGESKEDEDRLQDHIQEGEDEGDEEEGSRGFGLDGADEPGCAENPEKEDDGVAKEDGGAGSGHGWIRRD